MSPAVIGMIKIISTHVDITFLAARALFGHPRSKFPLIVSRVLCAAKVGDMSVCLSEMTSQEKKIVQFSPCFFHYADANSRRVAALLLPSISFTFTLVKRIRCCLKRKGFQVRCYICAWIKLEVVYQQRCVQMNDGMNELVSE